VSLLPPPPAGVAEYIFTCVSHPVAEHILTGVFVPGVDHRAGRKPGQSAF